MTLHEKQPSDETAKKWRIIIMKKRLVACLLVSAMTAGMLAGCSSGGDSKDTQTDSGSKEYPVIKIAYNVAYPTPDEQAVEDALNEIMREKAQAEVDIVPIDFGNWSTQLNLLLSGGGEDSVDLFNSFWYTSVSNLVSNGQVMALDDLLESDGGEIKTLFADGMEDYLKCGQVDGKQYGIPSIYSYCNENLYYVQEADTQKTGIDWDQVTDIDSMSDAILKLKEANPDKYFVPGTTDPYWVPKDIDNFGDSNFLGVLTNPTESTAVENYYESEYFLNWLGHVKEWKEAGVFSPDPLSQNQPTLNCLMMGISDGTTGYAWDVGVSMEATEVQNNLQLEGTNVTDALSTTGDATTFMWHISAFCKEPEAAMRILKVLYSDADAAQIAANGIEGLEYELDENGQMVYPEGKSGIADLGWPAASTAYWPNPTLCKTWSYEPEDIYEQMIEKNKTCDKSLALGFTFDSTNVADQITACSNVVAQYYTPLMYGEVDIDSALPEFQQALKKAGIDDIIAEKQAQLDAWLAEQ